MDRLWGVGMTNSAGGSSPVRWVDADGGSGIGEVTKCK